jgi:hypothetical protein
MRNVKTLTLALTCSGDLFIKGTAGRRECKLSGRSDNAAHDAAVAKVSEVLPYKSEILSHLDQVLASSEFCTSRRCQEFLSHLVQHSLSGDFDGIKERILGIRVFGRQADFDTSYDSIVRVTASDVRKRLLRFYTTTPAGAIRIELPPGLYIPEFHRVSGEPASSMMTMAKPDSMPEIDAIPASSSNGFTIRVDESISVSKSGEEASEQLDKSPQHSPVLYGRMRLGLAICFSCLVFLAVGWSFGALHTRSALLHASPTDVRYAFYKELLGPIATGPPRETKIVLSNPLLFLYRGSASPTPASDADRGEKKIPIPQGLAADFVGAADDPQVESPYHYLALDTTDYTGLGEAQTAVSLQKLFDVLDRSAHLTEGRFLNWNEARDQDLVLLGARHMNPWNQGNVLAANFKMDHNVIHNAHPKPGEQPTYAAKMDEGVLVDYGLIWMSQAPSGSRVLVLAGLTSTGTAGVGAFFIDPSKMKPVFEKLKSASSNGSVPANWQALLKITARDDVPINVSFVTLRIANTNP